MPGVPVIITGASSSVAGTTRTVLRHRLLETLGLFLTGTVTTVAASLEAASTIISTAIRSDQRERSHLDGLYAYIYGPDGAAEQGTQRLVVSASYDGPIGAATTDYPYDSGALASATQFELAVMPAEKYLGCEGANHCLNLALETLPVVDFVPLTLTATGGVSDTQYGFDSYPYPVRGIESVVYPRTLTASESRRVVAPGSYGFYRDGEQAVLSFSSLPGNVGDVVEVGLLRPATTWIKSGGVWASSTTGLAAESDCCAYDALTVVNAARPIALEAMALMTERGSKERADLLAEAERAGVTAAVSRWYQSFGRGARVQSARTTGGGQRGTWWTGTRW
jgi:hypothetical protein